ncbi:hypothetical protein HYPSUDRAFT_36055 [Hypholoma sublateritium FD-334 SS-4]|uniref:ADP-ribosylhydrolase ARH3 n=1 Tax=Hypholoma sublateritium (strain FD-334 SS-4) TaxID=945553 RepID=A0A0D2PE78_HYPSF|nr:hypothetical protein HYPSUDRAFT_36055 [Hypholoma sublateritium FD-334 SS-4]
MFFAKRALKFGKSKSTDNVPGSPGRASSSPLPPPPSALYAQHPTPSSVSTKIRLSILATAMVDALGGPAEFQERFSFSFITHMLPNDNFRLPAGVWSDDTSMMLCLAKSISSFKPSPNSTHIGGFNEGDQLRLYGRWHRSGYLSAIGRCFDIGNTVARALTIYARHRNNPTEALELIRSELSEEANSGNGSLMRVLPIGLAYWRDGDEAKMYAKRSSQVTHPAQMCGEACQFLTALITLAMEKTVLPLDSLEEDPPFSKLSLLEFIIRYPFENHKLLVALTLPYGLPPRPEDRVEREAYYYKFHPLLRLVAATQTEPLPKDNKFPYHIPSEESVPSSGYVLHTLIAALYCFFATRTFEEGALMAVNLGDDADTVGAVYAGLAAVWYSGDEEEAEGVFWTKRVREWRRTLVATQMIDEVTEDLLGWERKLAD